MNHIKANITTCKTAKTFQDTKKSPFRIMLLFLAFVMFFPKISFSQSEEDILLLRNHNYENKAFKEREVSYGFRQAKSGNVVYHVLSSSMYVYQKCLSPVLSRSCGFTPSCSAYSKELIRYYGLFKGVVCTTDRLMRCSRVAFAGKPSDYFDIKTGKHNEDVYIYSLRPAKLVDRPKE